MESVWNVANEIELEDRIKWKGKTELVEPEASTVTLVIMEHSKITVEADSLEGADV